MAMTSDALKTNQTRRPRSGKDAPGCFFLTLGCAKNEVDTDRMRAQLLRAGFETCEDVHDADIAIVNTCSFLSVATQESIEATLQLAQETAGDIKSLPIVMCGCVPSRYGDELTGGLPEVAAFVPAQEEGRIVEVVCDVLGVVTPAAPGGPRTPLRTIEGASAYVKISDGCDRFCAFCAIPYIRGEYFSRPSEDICEEVRHLMEGGVREIVLIGQDTGIWGSDLEDKKDLAWLLEEVAREVRPYKGWVRVLYLQPEGMTDRLIDAMRSIPEVLPYIDIPIQHCNERILARMCRSGSREELASLIARLRELIPGMVLRSTGMVGCPGETQEEADELVDFVNEVGFDYTSVFAYSQEEGTAAAEMEDQIDEDTKLERTQRLLDVAEQIGFEATASHVGEVVDVIVDGIERTDEGTELIGHTWFQAPDSDGAVHIESGEAAVGDMVKCLLVDSFCYELVGTIVENAEEAV